MGEVDDNAVVTDAGAGRKGPAGSREHCDPGTGWRGRDEGESSGELDGPPSERRDVPVLERLSQQFDGIAAIGELVEEQHAVVPRCSHMSLGANVHAGLMKERRFHGAIERSTSQAW
jgi:hypothetical protein